MAKTLKWWALGATIALAAVAGSGLLVLADDDNAALAARLSKSGEILPLEQILAHAKAERPGKMLETELEHERGRYVYEVKILDDKGVVWKLKLDAKTGTLIRSKQKQEGD